MSLRDLVEGECGGANSLVGLTSHYVQDRGMKDEGIGHGFSLSNDNFSNTDADQLVNQFLGETLGHAPNTFRMDSLLEEMREIEMNAPIQGPGVAALATANPYMLQEQDSIWAEQYLGSGKQFDQEFHEGDQTWSSNAQHQPNEVFEFGFGPNWAQEYLQSSEHTVDATDLWTDAAQKIETSQEKAELQETANQLLESTMDDPKFTYSKFMKFMGMIGDGAVSIEKGNVVENEWAQEFESLNQEPKVASRWVKQFMPESEDTYATTTEVTSPATDSSQKEMLSMLKKQWKLASENTEQEWMSDFLDQYEAYKTYPFAEDNPMKSSSDPLAEGKRKLEAGDLPSAVLCFEVAAQQNPDSIESWLLLGTTQAENEQDPSAIPALKKCLSLDPSNLTAMMALAVSYTNESYQNQACQLLKDWLRHNPKYSDLVASTPDDEHMMNMASMGIASSMLSPASYQEVKDLFIKAARLNPQNNIDADVQCGLGVLFNLSSEFDKAVDCFKAALQVKSQDSRMWNRLGATLANGNRSEEAVDAYHNALQLAPGFIRARYNLGITCVNLKAHREAAEHLLTALNQQAAGRGMEGQASWSTMSDSIWSTLRLVTSLLDRHDLFPYIETRDLKKLNSEFGIE